ncbi:hypothetical protein HNY73_001053 [Argiope bruennichi]|uniref:Uncharacterized protein n=1 Tax=Argiope bruennichi TaxID=94029 RepID=A0A8T0G034_ARGBR|nr:hypothetical protein HNY73_001053 [Argiope bruennichi]
MSREIAIVESTGYSTNSPPYETVSNYTEKLYEDMKFACISDETESDKGRYSIYQKADELKKWIHEQEISANDLLKKPVEKRKMSNNLDNESPLKKVMLENVITLKYGPSRKTQIIDYNPSIPEKIYVRKGNIRHVYKMSHVEKFEDNEFKRMNMKNTTPKDTKVSPIKKHIVCGECGDPVIMDEEVFTLSCGCTLHSFCLTYRGDEMLDCATCGWAITPKDRVALNAMSN